MRPIKFRGKTRFSNEWIYGHYYIDMGDHFIHLDEPKDTVVAWLVRPETVGQFTGLTDMDGKEIYEGDVVDGLLHDEIVSAEVFFDEGAFSLKLKDGKNDYFPCLWEVPKNSLKVINNIHENPELIEGGDAIEKQKQD